MQRRQARLVVGASVVSVVLGFGSGAAAAGSEPPARPADGTFRVGALLPQTGQLSLIGPPMIYGVRMAVQEVNAAGGVDGRPAELFEQDDGTDPAVANAATDKLLADHVDEIVGAGASSVSLAMIPKISGAGVVQCAASNTSMELSDFPDHGWYFRTSPSDDLQARVLSKLIVDDDHHKVTIVARKDQYGTGFAARLQKDLRSREAEVKTIIYDQTAKSFTDVAHRIASSKPRAVVLIAFDEGGPIVRDSIDAGVGPRDVAWYGTPSIQSSTFSQKVDPSDPTKVENIKGTAPSATPATGERTFPDRFHSFAPPGTGLLYAGYAYDCVVIAALAATEARSTSPTEIRKHMVDVTKRGTKCSLYADCVRLLRDGRDIAYRGAAGALDLTARGEPAKASYDIWRFDAQGKVVTLEASVATG